MTANQTDTPDLYKSLELMDFGVFEAIKLAEASKNAAAGNNQAQALRILMALVDRYLFSHFLILPFPEQISSGRSPFLVPTHP